MLNRILIALWCALLLSPLSFGAPPTDAHWALYQTIFNRAIQYEAKTSRHWCDFLLKPKPVHTSKDELDPEKLAELPNLRRNLDDLVQDPTAPAFLKQLVLFVVNHPKLVIRALNPVNAAKYHSSETAKTANGLYIANPIYETYEDPNAPRMPSVADDEITDNLGADHVILVPDLPSNARKAGQALSTFFHEAAHFVFELYLSSLYLDPSQPLVDLLPTRIGKNGAIEIEEQARTFLHERFAHEMSYLAFQWFGGEATFGGAPESLEWALNRLDYFDTRLSHYLLDAYEFKHPWTLERRNTRSPELFFKKAAETTPARYTKTTPLLAFYVGEEIGKADATHLLFAGLDVHYMTDEERERYQVHFKDGLLVNRYGKPLCSTPCKGSYVMAQNGEIYFNDDDALSEFTHERFFHSTFVGGKPVSAAGTLSIKNGRLHMISNESGHYKPSWETNVQVLIELKRQGVNTPEVIGLAVKKAAFRGDKSTVELPYTQMATQLQMWMDSLNVD